MIPLAIDLFCGLGGWTEGLLAEGFDVIGFDIEHHQYGDAKYPAQLVLQDVLTLHGRQFKDAALIVASPPCQAYSYRAMPWSRAKALPPPDNSLFEACFRIQREAIEAAGHFIPLVVENVRGAQKWVGRARWNFGSFYLWGDVPALMPMVRKHVKVDGFRFDGSGKSFQSASVEHTKNNGGSWFAIAHNTTSGHSQNARDQLVAEGRKTMGNVNQRDGHSHARHLTNPAEHEGVKVSGLADGRFPPGGLAQGYIDGTKQKGDWFGSGADCSLQRRAGSKSNARKAASAAIAKIPFVLARHIARTWKPHESEPVQPVAVAIAITV
jgi:hypothetical protein